MRGQRVRTEARINGILSGVGLVPVVCPGAKSDCHKHRQGPKLRVPLSGYWDLESRRWISTAADWPVKDLIGPAVPEATAVEPTAVHGIFFGDSNDRNMLNDFCLKEEPQAQPHGHNVDTFKTCWHKNLTLSWQALVGVHPTGPYWNGVRGTPSERLEHGLSTMNSQLQASPDFVVVSSNLWDLWHWVTSNVSLLDDMKIASRELSAWGPHLSELLQQVEVRIPGVD